MRERGGGRGRGLAGVCEKGERMKNYKPCMSNLFPNGCSLSSRSEGNSVPDCVLEGV